MSSIPSDPEGLAVESRFGNLAHRTEIKKAEPGAFRHAEFEFIGRPAGKGAEAIDFAEIAGRR